MVELDLIRLTKAHQQLTAREEHEINSLRDERQRTGRYIALAVAIFLSLLGLYQAVVRGTPQYAALFAPALIMFIYMLWILNASANQRKPMLSAEAVSAKGEWETAEESAPENNDTAGQMQDGKQGGGRCAGERDLEGGNVIYSRSYSIA